MSFDAQFWSAISFLIFIALAFKPIKGLMTKALDDRSLSIQKELDEALRLKEEAELLLISCQRKYKEVIEEASQIMAHAQEENRRVAEEARLSLEAAIAKRTELANQKIANYEAALLQEVRVHAVELAVKAAKQLIVKDMDATISDSLVNQAISDISRKLH
jgi:F-type H+-transporting ATPase subunit b